MQRMAGENNIMNTMMANLEKNDRLMKQLAAESQQKMAEQTRRDIAAAYGKVIPFH
mgnify:FL=1|jgi:tetrahydromethanopterin S-methyltransferase subunit G